MYSVQLVLCCGPGIGGGTHCCHHIAHLLHTHRKTRTHSNDDKRILTHVYIAGNGTRAHTHTHTFANVLYD